MCEIICVKKKIGSLSCLVAIWGFFFFLHDKEAGGEVREVFLSLSHCGELRVAH